VSEEGKRQNDSEAQLRNETRAKARQLHSTEVMKMLSLSLRLSLLGC
jgi:hypothetical protein